MNVTKNFFAQCMIACIAFPIIANAQTIQNGSWSTASGDVKFYVSQHSQIDTLSIRITHTSGSCSGSLTKYYYGISISDWSFSANLGSTWDGSTGSITGDFSPDGASCSGSYAYTEPPCSPLNVSWTAIATGPDTTEEAFVEIDDPNFLNALIEQGVDTNGDEMISFSEAEAVVSLDVSDREIADMKGIEAFENLELVSCRNNALVNLDVSNNPALRVLYCSNNQLTGLDVSRNPDLWRLWCSHNQLTSLDVSDNGDLEDLWCGDNQISSLDVSNNLFLMFLWCEGNLLTTLDVSNNTLIAKLVCRENELSSLDVSNNLVLEELSCGDNRLLNLDISNNPSLVELWCYDNLLTSLDLTSTTLITKLVCWENKLTSLDVSNKKALKELWCGDNLLISLDVTSNPALEVLSCYSNKLLKLDVSHNPALAILHCGSNQIESLDISANTAIGTADIDYAALDISDMPSLYEVCVWTMPFPPAGVTVNTVSSPNAFFTTECSGATGLEEIRPSAPEVYPNPFRDLLTIRTDSYDELSLTVTFPNGQTIMHRNSAGKLHRMDLSFLRGGVYFLTIRSSDLVITKQIVKL